MNFAQVVETSVTITDNSPFKDYIHPDDQTTLLKLGLFFEPLSDKILIILFREVGLQRVPRHEEFDLCLCSFSFVPHDVCTCVVAR